MDDSAFKVTDDLKVCQKVIDQLLTEKHKNFFDSHT